MKRFSFFVIVSSLFFVSACSSGTQADVKDMVNGAVNTASGAAGQVKNTVKDMKRRADDISEGWQHIQSGANLIKKAL